MVPAEMIGETTTAVPVVTTTDAKVVELTATEAIREDTIDPVAVRVAMDAMTTRVVLLEARVGMEASRVDTTDRAVVRVTTDATTTTTVPPEGLVARAAMAVKTAMIALQVVLEATVAKKIDMVPRARLTLVHSPIKSLLLTTPLPRQATVVPIVLGDNLVVAMAAAKISMMTKS